MKKVSLITKHAPALKVSWKSIEKDFKSLNSLLYLDEIVNSLPFIATILNEERQIVFGNNKLLQKMGISDLNHILGLRPGEALGCINALKEEGGCGTSENCKYCGSVNSILASQKSRTRVVDECRISAEVDGEPISYDFQVTASPFVWNGKNFTMFTLLDISHDKRRRALERIFFHDILNKTGSLSGYLELINDLDDYNSVKELTDIMEGITHDLNEEIMAQRELLTAENNELVAHFSPIDSLELILVTVNQMRHHQVATEKFIEMDEKTTSTIVNTDAVLLKRVLINMIKNGLEASPFGSKIIVGGEKIEENFRFWVNNPAFMPREIQLQMFQRSFSTKGVNRGIGSYSMKLLGEKFLKGKVNFITNEQSGTTFYIDLPINN